MVKAESCVCVKHIYCNMSVHASACDVKKPDEVTQSVRLWGARLAFSVTTLLHFPSCQNLSLLLSSFQLLPLGKKNQVCSGALPIKALYLCLS